MATSAMAQHPAARQTSLVPGVIGRAIVVTSAGLRRVIAAIVLALPRVVCGFCFDDAGHAYRIDPLLLQAIATVESGLRPDVLNRNGNGTHDIGLMQINSIHLPRLMPHGIDESRLLDEPCTSVMVGAEILAALIGRHGYGWRAVGAYNAGSAASREGARRRYIDKVWRRYAPLIERKRRRDHGARFRPFRFVDIATARPPTLTVVGANVSQKTLHVGRYRTDNLGAGIYGRGHGAVTAFCGGVPPENHRALDSSGVRQASIFSTPHGVQNIAQPCPPCPNASTLLQATRRVPPRRPYRQSVASVPTIVRIRAPCG